MALHRLLAPLDLALVPAIGDEAVDIDSWADLRDLGVSLAAPAGWRCETLGP